MQAKGLSFVMLGAADVDRSVGFYRDDLGLRVQSRFEGFAFFEAGAVTLALSEELAGRAPASPEGVELVFAVDSVTETYGALKGTIAFVNEPRAVNGDNWAVNFNDPDGHALSFYGPR
jgi:catechol 2,3-dioxygenase-like lactoylglutathione lyase family enzyme